MKMCGSYSAGFIRSYLIWNYAIYSEKIIFFRIFENVMSTVMWLNSVYHNFLIECVLSSGIISEFVLFLLGEERQPETVDNKGNSVRSRLIDRCNHVSEEVRFIEI